jgi:hypothetical protein
MAIPSLSEAISELSGTFSGKLLQPHNSGYDSARRVHNGLIDKRPALIARCKGTADIADAVKLAGEHGLEVAIRGGGHNVAGRCTTNGGLMIDLAEMTGVRVDPQTRTAPRAVSLGGFSTARPRSTGSPLPVASSRRLELQD